MVEHGANPGPDQPLHQAGPARHRRGLPRRAEGRRRAGRADSPATPTAQAFNHLAHELGVKVIHCSERDTQIGNRPKEVDEFVNTWSVEGFREEGTTTAELGWGTHERELPEFAYEHTDGPRRPDLPGPDGDQHAGRPAGCRAARSWGWSSATARPSRSPTISRSGRHGRAVYRPTVHYAYCPCDAAIAALWELRGRDYEIQPRRADHDDEIVCGADILGALLMGHPLGAWWCGSILSIEEIRRLVPGQNATTMQVAISVVAAVMWMIETSGRGAARARRLAPRRRFSASPSPISATSSRRRATGGRQARTAAARRGDDPTRSGSFATSCSPTVTTSRTWSPARPPPPAPGTLRPRFRARPPVANGESRRPPVRSEFAVSATPARVGHAEPPATAPVSRSINGRRANCESPKAR